MGKRRSFVEGALILTAAGILSKLIGAVYRIPFANLVGNEGIGLYQMAYPIYTALLAVSTAGVPVAVSIMVAESLGKGDRRGANKVLVTALILLGVVGFIFSVALFRGADFIANNYLYDPRAAHSLRFISPALFFTALMSPLRGYFQGGENMLPTAVSQVLEQTVRVITIFIGAYLLLPYGLEYAAAGATFGAVTGGLAALIVLIIFLVTQLGSRGAPTSITYRHSAVRLMRLAVPVCLGGLVMPIMQGIDAMIVPLRLRTLGYDVQGATSMYGELTGMAGPLINLPGVVTMALAASIVPAVSSALAQGRIKVLQRRVEEALRISVLICLPAAVGLGVLATPISFTLYNLPTMGPTLAALAPAALFLGIHQATAGSLQGMGKTGLPVRNLFLGSIAKVIVTYSLTARPDWGIRGAALGSVIGFALSAGLNISELKKLLPYGLYIGKILFKPVLAATIMAIGLRVMSNLFTLERLTGLMLVFIGGLIYGTALLLLGELRAKEVARIPGIGISLAKFLQNIGIVRE